MARALVASILSMGAFNGHSQCFAWQPTAADVENTLIQELSLLATSGQPHRLEQSLKPLFDGQAKNAHGNLAPAEARSALRAAFLQQAGWGLRAELPDRLAAQLEQRTGGKGLGLRELAVLGSSIESLVRAESTQRLAASYEALNLSTKGSASRADALSALTHYAKAYLGESPSSAAWLQRLDKQGAAWKPSGAEVAFADAVAATAGLERALSAMKSQDCQTEGPSCLDVSGIYELCCRENAASEPSVLAAAMADYPKTWAASLAALALTAVLQVLLHFFGQNAADASEEKVEGEKAAAESTEKEQVAAGRPQPWGAILALGLLCAAAVALDLLDAHIIAPALVAGLALLLAARFAPAQKKPAKKVA